MTSQLSSYFYRTPGSKMFQAVPQRSWQHVFNNRLPEPKIDCGTHCSPVSQIIPISCKETAGIHVFLPRNNTIIGFLPTFLSNTGRKSFMFNCKQRHEVQFRCPSNKKSLTNINIYQTCPYLLFPKLYPTKISRNW